MQNHDVGIIYAGFFVRLAAFAVDSLIVWAVLLLLRIPMGLITFFYGRTPLTNPLLFQYSLWDVLMYLLGALYFVLLTYYTGTTLGKRLFRIKVISVGQEGKLTFQDVLYRETIGRFLSSAVIYIGYLIIGADGEKKGLHDILCDTRVVYVKPVDNRISRGSGHLLPVVPKEEERSEIK